MHDGIVASLRKVTKAFMCFAVNVDYQCSFVSRKRIVCSTRDIEKKKDVFHLPYIEKTFFYLILFRFNDTRGFHNDQENVEIISFSFFFFWIDKSIQ